MSWIGAGVVAGLIVGSVIGWALRGRGDRRREWALAEARELRGHLHVLQYRAAEAERRAGEAEGRIAEAERQAAEAEQRAAMADQILASYAEARLRADPRPADPVTPQAAAVPPAPSMPAVSPDPPQRATEPELGEEGGPPTDPAFEAIKAKSDALRLERERREEDEERRRREGG